VFGHVGHGDHEDEAEHGSEAAPDRESALGSGGSPPAATSFSPGPKGAEAFAVNSESSRWISRTVISTMARSLRDGHLLVASHGAGVLTDSFSGRAGSHGCGPPTAMPVRLCRRRERPPT
jgi:hypothetical protein